MPPATTALPRMLLTTLLLASHSAVVLADLGAITILDGTPPPAGAQQSRRRRQRIFGPSAARDSGSDGGPPPQPPAPPLAVSLLHPENGTVKSTFPSFGTLAGGIAGECNAAFDATTGWFYKVSDKGELLTIDPRSAGQVVNRVQLTGGPDSNKGSETFLAGPDANGLLYTAVPLSYTTFNILSYNISSGEVTSISTQPKGNMDGLGICVGFMVDQDLYFVFKDDLVKYDTVKGGNVSVAIKEFPAPVALDPAQKGTVLAITEDHKGNTTLSRFDLSSGAATSLYTFNAT